MHSVMMDNQLAKLYCTYDGHV